MAQDCAARYSKGFPSACQSRKLRVEMPFQLPFGSFS